MTPRVVAIALYALVFAAVGASGPYINIYLQSLGLPLDAIGLIATLAALCALVAAPVWGLLSDQAFGARTALLAAPALATLCALGVSLASAALIAALFWIAYYLFYAGLGPVLDAYTLDIVGSDRHSYSRFRVWGSASFVVVSILVGILIQQSTIHALFIGLIASLIGVVVLATLLPARTLTHAERSLSGLGTVLRTRVLVIFIAAILVVWSASTMVNAFYSIYLAALNTPPALIGTAWALGAVVEVPIMLAYPLLATRFGVNRLLVIGAVCLLLRALVVVFASDPLIVVAAMGLHGAGFALVLIGGVTYVARHAPVGSAATAQGVLAGVAFGLAQAIGPGIGGLIANATSLHAMFIVAAVSSGVGVGALAVALYGVRTANEPVQQVGASRDLNATRRQPRT